jgi:ribonuclease P protein component
MRCYQEGIRTGAFKKSERITTEKDIRALFQQGKKVSVTGAKLFYSKNAQEATRFAVTFPRGYGTSVTRNRTKRLCRESFRVQKAQLVCGYDLLFLVYQNKSENFQGRYSQLHSLCKKAGLVHNEVLA